MILRRQASILFHAQHEDGANNNNTKQQQQHRCKLLKVQSPRQSEQQRREWIYCSRTISQLLSHAVIDVYMTRRSFDHYQTRE